MTTKVWVGVLLNASSSFNYGKVVFIYFFSFWVHGQYVCALTNSGRSQLIVVWFFGFYPVLLIRRQGWKTFLISFNLRITKLGESKETHCIISAQLWLISFIIIILFNAKILSIKQTSQLGKTDWSEKKLLQSFLYIYFQRIKCIAFGLYFPADYFIKRTLIQ